MKQAGMMDSKTLYWREISLRAMKIAPCTKISIAIWESGLARLSNSFFGGQYFKYSMAVDKQR